MTDGHFLSTDAGTFAGNVADETVATAGGRPQPIARSERVARIVMAQDHMRRLGYSAIVIEPGASMADFAGIQFHRSERPACLILTVDGDVGIVTPFFEEATLRESLKVAADIRTLREHEDAMAVVASWLRDRGLAAAVIGFEETTRLFIVDGLARNLPSAEIRNGAQVTRACRWIKSPGEIALMQYANDITITAYRDVIPRIDAVMRPADITAMMEDDHERRGAVSVFEDALIGKSAAFSPRRCLASSTV